MFQANRDTMARIRNCISALVAAKMMLDDTSIMAAYEESMKYDRAKELLDPEAMLDIAFLTQHRIHSSEQWQFFFFHIHTSIHILYNSGYGLMNLNSVIDSY